MDLDQVQYPNSPKTHTPIVYIVYYQMGEMPGMPHPSQQNFVIPQQAFTGPHTHSQVRGKPFLCGILKHV